MSSIICLNTKIGSAQKIGVINLQENIMVVDDNPEIREVVNVLLSSEGYNIIEAANGDEALKKIDGTIDLIILDVMMPKMNGYQACLKLREKTNAPILFLTAKGQESDKTLGFSSGGDDYLTKPFSYNELNARVKALLRRYHIYQGNPKNEQTENIVLKIGSIKIDETHRRVFKDEEIIALTDMEYEILDYFARNRKIVISLESLYEAIWKEDYYYGANNTVMVHIRNLRKKIEENAQDPQIIKTLWGKGYYCD